MKRKSRNHSKKKLPKNPYKELSAYEWDNPEYFKKVDILSLLPTNKLKEIEKDFPHKKEKIQTKKGLKLHEFLLTMHTHLNQRKIESDKLRLIEKIKVTINLIRLFEEIDVNGDEYMEWDEFSNHIIELGMVKKDLKDGTKSDVIKKYYPNYHVTDKTKK